MICLYQSGKHRMAISMCPPLPIGGGGGAIFALLLEILIAAIPTTYVCVYVVRRSIYIYTHLHVVLYVRHMYDVLCIIALSNIIYKVLMIFVTTPELGR